ncbi:MAG: arylsulfatase [Paracoccaceae bacterium]
MPAEDSRPNILLIVTDQQRGDALGIAGHPVVQTPNMDEIGAFGTHFTRAYSAHPVCVPARRTLMTGATAAHHGVFMNYDTRLDLPTLPAALTAAGYHTHLSGKLHLHPPRKLHGFMSADWADSPAQWNLGRYRTDYQRFLVENGFVGTDAGYAAGASNNGWVSRPFHLEERFHYTNWTVDCALRFLERRDPTVPFFLNLSIFAPHQPCMPPAYYFDKYLDADLPDPPVGDWARVYDEPQRGLGVNAWRVCLEPDALRRMRAGYFGSIEHVDHQIGRLMKHLPENTVIMFVSDHGEMLGDHQWLRKRVPYEGSANIPFLLRLPKSMGVAQGRAVDRPVELMDVMPTLLDIAGVEVPETVDGKSVMPLIRGEDTGWRDWLHGECTRIVTMNSGVQFITDGREKYVWYPGPGIEQFFDLVADPQEMTNLADDPVHAARVALFRDRLIATLDGRPEGFVRDGRLQVLGGDTQMFLPGFNRPEHDYSSKIGKGLLDGDR